MSIKSVVKAAAAAVVLSLAAMPAGAAPIMGSRVDESVFMSAIGTAQGWAYVGQRTSSPFTTQGYARLVGHASPYAHSFGYMATDYSGKTEIYNETSALGTAAAGNYVTYIPFTPMSEFIFYFQADAMANPNAGDNWSYTDGGGTGDLEIFRNASANIWAFFFDDGGLGPDSASDFNDLVITFDQGAAGVPAPGALGLFGLSALGILYMRRRKTLLAGA